MNDRKKNLTKSNRKNIEKKLQRLNDLYVNGFIDMVKYKTDYADLQSQIIDEPKEEKKDLTAAKEFLDNNYIALYDDLSRTERQTLWRSIIKEIKISNKKVSEVIFL